ncbi:hypothetical protein SO802_033596 [Lithocarpus litseifolius]|uniref:Uncharacterized protein n=1 Tax=Lithocarpus litseifolius TaxID=425828 RepID=A0AAW2BFH8_9ROSI
MVSPKDIVSAAKNDMNTQFIILNKRNKTCLALVAIETAAVHFQLLGDDCDAFDSGDIIHLTNGILNFILQPEKLGAKGWQERIEREIVVFA